MVIPRVVFQRFLLAVLLDTCWFFLQYLTVCKYVGHLAECCLFGAFLILL